ncbi:LruC domain-containing protein [Alistipes sp.]|uniref:LruC domain-containing protein n=1 Tax=Alistipes sp. TaxID=1872444 RepID=UPI003AF0A3D7
MKKNLLIFATLLLVVGGGIGCTKSDLPDGPGTPDELPYYPFGFTTEQPTTLDISYTNMDGMTAAVYFEIYDRCPVETNADGSSYVRIDGIEPIYAGITREDGTFRGKIQLPAYLDKAWVYTPAFYAQTLIEAPITDGVLRAADQASPAESASSSRAGHNSEAVTRDGWKTYLGSYDSKTGRIDYKYTGELRAKNFAGLYTAHASVINTNRNCPQEYRSSSDLLITEPAEIAVTFLGSNTCWNCSMGYYYYPEGQKPASLKDAGVIMIFPNTQDGRWSVNISQSSRYKGVNRGEAVQLKYFPDIDNPKSGTTVFPANMRIGFVLACNAWTNRLPGFTQSKGYRAATSSGLSVDDKGHAFDEPRTAVYRYIDKKKDINAVMFSFEDYTSDENFSDVVFTLNSNPVEAVTTPPSVETDGDNKQTVKFDRGIYSFEDLWPSRGDFDMNDVMVKASYEKSFGEKGVYGESFLYKTFPNSTTGLENGLAVTLEGPAVSASVDCYVMSPASAQNPNPEFEKTQVRREGNVLFLTDNVKQAAGSVYKITMAYATPVENGSVCKPFIFRQKSGNDKRWELHLPFEAPTAGVDMSYFGQSDDRSVPEKGVYYVRELMYPFAFFLSGATESDVRPLLDPANEKVAIDVLFPDYKGWAMSQGTTNKDWYKK